ncbi:MAG: hypothetical protein EOO53_02430 [Gammaproteobacteria bacterium]|nr:MAG: hypothetical protein EOO53_02430 [Gammaproteobacteria bacterium]
MLDTIRNLNADFDAIFDEAVQSPKEDVRGSRSALPLDVYYYLSEVQRIALNSLENLGGNWHLFVVLYLCHQWWLLKILRKPNLLFWKKMAA